MKRTPAIESSGSIPGMLFSLLVLAVTSGRPALLAAEGAAAPAPAVPGPLTLEQALDFARAHHPDLALARAAVEVAAADSIAARVRPFNPELEFGFARSGGDNSAAGDRNVEIALNQEFELGGKQSQRRKVAAARLLTASRNLEARRQEIEVGARARFQQVLVLERRLAFLEGVQELDRRVVAAVKARAQDGSVTALTGRLAELDFLKVEAQVMEARSDRRQALYALGQALGGHVEETIELEGTLSADSLALAPSALVALALERRAGVELLRRKVDERTAEIELARREARPNVTVGVGVAFERQVLAGDAVNEDRLLQLRLGVPLPLAQRNQGGRAKSMAELHEAESELDRFSFQLRLEVESTARRFFDATQIYRLFLSGAAHAADDLALVREAYTDGRINLESYLIQKTRLIDALLGQFDAGERYWDARTKLESAIGSGLSGLEGVAPDVH